MNSSGRCEVGMKRKNNEDSIFIFNTGYACLPNLYIVADGMGGHNAGEVASKSAIQFFCEYIHNNSTTRNAREDEILDLLVSGVHYVNEKILEESKKVPEYEGMGTTFTVLVVKEDKAFIAHVGDSRVYLIRDHAINQVTNDHSYVADLVKLGEITAEEARIHPRRNLITRAIGADSNVYADTKILNLHQSDLILMCSDGLTTMLDDNEILEILNENTSLEHGAQILLNEANQKGGLDNISIILIQ